MGQIPIAVNDIVALYIRKLNDSGYRINHAILFGSQVSGRTHEYSDIDIAIVSDAFIGDPFDDKKAIRKITLSVSDRLSPIPYNTGDFDETDPFVKEILETGIRIC